MLGNDYDDGDDSTQGDDDLEYMRNMFSCFFLLCYMTCADALLCTCNMRSH